jgi:hypothetical protein
MEGWFEVARMIGFDPEEGMTVRMCRSLHRTA